MRVALRSAPRPLQPSGALAPDPVCLEDLAGSSRESRGGRHREPLGRVFQLGVGLGRVRSLVPQSGEWSLSVLVFLTVCSRPTAPVRTAETLLPVGSSPASVCLSPRDPFCTVPCPAEGLCLSLSPWQGPRRRTEGRTGQGACVIRGQRAGWGCSAFWSLSLCSSPALCSRTSRGGDLAAAAGSELARRPREPLALFGMERVHPCRAFCEQH